MRKGFSLVEILVSISLVFCVTCGTVKFLLVSNRFGSDSDTSTYASVIAQTKLYSLKKMPSENVDIKAGWHEDAANPIVQESHSYYRFWRVFLRKDGSRALNVYVAWDEKGSHGTGFKVDGIESWSGPKVVFRGIRDPLMP